MFVLRLDNKVAKDGPEALAEWVRSVAARLAEGEDNGSVILNGDKVGYFILTPPMKFK